MEKSIARAILMVMFLLTAAIASHGAEEKTTFSKDCDKP